MSDEERKLTAYHEAGHAVVGLNVPQHDPIHKATIIPRGRALGLVLSLPERDQLSVTMTKYKSMIAMAMGGKVAEELVFGPENVTSGAASDIQQVSRIARAMVTKFGMSDKLGNIDYAGEQFTYLGPQTGGVNAGPDTHELIDSEVRVLVDEGYETAKRILIEKRDDLDRLANGLLEYETLTGKEITRVIHGQPLNRGADDDDAKDEGGGHRRHPEDRQGGAPGARRRRAWSRSPRPEAGPAWRAGRQHVVVMGVAGCGKTTIGERLAAALGWPFDEGDRYHLPASVAKMSAGIPLEDADRWPWLAELAALMGEHEAAGRSSVLACSALKRAYRDLLRTGAPRVRFLHLHGSREVLQARLDARKGHFFPPDLLASQFAALEPLEPDEDGVVVDVALPVEAQVEAALRGLGLAGRAVGAAAAVTPAAPPVRPAEERLAETLRGERWPGSRKGSRSSGRLTVGRLCGLPPAEADFVRCVRVLPACWRGPASAR